MPLYPAVPFPASPAAVVPAGWPPELAGAGIVAVRVADLACPLRRPLREGDRTALTAAGAGKIRTGDLVVFRKPVAVAPAVVRRDGKVQAGGHPADHARLGILEQQLDEMTGQPGVIDLAAAQSVPRGKVKGTARRSMTMAAAGRAAEPDHQEGARAGAGAEMDEHLGYVRGDPAGNGSGNSRNGFYGKTVTTTAGPVRLQVPRDRNSEFEPVIVPKGTRRLGQVDDMILSLYSRGMTTRDIQAHLAEVYGADVSPALISKVTDVVAEEITAWQTRPLDSFYAILYIDALMVKVRDGGTVDNEAAYLVTGVDIDGFKHVLGIWLAASEGARFWAGVLAELRNRGIKDVLFTCCDGLGGLPEAIEATWPKAIVQTCVIHLIRASMRYVSWKDRKKAAAAMRPVYTAVNEAAAKAALDDLRRDFGKKAPAWSQPGNEPGTSSSRSCSSTPPSARSSTRPTPSSPSTSSCARSSRTAATSPTTTPRSSCSTSASATSPDGTSTATAASANEENAAPAATAGKQPSTPSPSTSATASPSNPRNPQ